MLMLVLIRMDNTAVVSVRVLAVCVLLVAVEQRVQCNMPFKTVQSRSKSTCAFPAETVVVIREGRGLSLQVSHWGTVCE